MPAAAATAAATVVSGGMQANAAGNASKEANKAAQANLDFTKGVYNDAKSNLNPTIQGGIGAGNALQGLLGTGGDPAASQKAFDTFRNSTNYNFLLDQGTQAVKTANAPSFNSGATAKALQTYGQGMAGNALSGYENMLQGQQTLGAQSASALAGNGASFGSLVSSANNNAAGVAGSAGIYSANAGQNALSGLTSLFNKQATSSSFSGGGGSSAGPADLQGLY